MSSAKPFLSECSNANCPPCLTGEHYDFWKIRVEMFLEVQGVEICNMAKNCLYVPTTVLNGVTSIKPNNLVMMLITRKFYTTKGQKYSCIRSRNG